MIERSAVVGAVLAGGQSRRMFPGSPDGGDKSLRLLGGRPMLAHVLDRLAPQANRCIINANGDPARFAAFGLPVVPDAFSGHPGPLAGILAGLRWTSSHDPGASHMVSVSGDAPFIPPDLVARLAAAADGAPSSTAIARSAGGLHPVIGLWPLRVIDDLDAALAAGMRKVQTWAEHCGAVAVDFAPIAIGGQLVDPFFNANHPHEFDFACHLISQVDVR